MNEITEGEAVGLLTTYQCNLNCSYCYISQKKHKNMALETAIQILEPVLSASGGPVEILLMGAETLAAEPMVRALVEWAERGHWKRKYHFSGSTNGTLLTEEGKRWFYEHRENITLGLSYDGVPSSQDQNRSNSSGRIDLDFFLEAWPNQKVQMTINEESVPAMAEGVLFLLEYGFHVNANAAYEEKEWSPGSLREYRRQLRLLMDYYLKHPDAKRIDQFIHCLPEYAHNLVNTPKPDRRCGAGDGFWVYDIDARRYPCHILSPLVLNREQLGRLEAAEFPPPGGFGSFRCAGCPYVTACPTCMGCNFRYRGSLQERDLTHCRLMRMEAWVFMEFEAKRLIGKGELNGDDALIVDSIVALRGFWQKKDAFRKMD